MRRPLLPCLILSLVSVSWSSKPARADTWSNSEWDGDFNPPAAKRRSDLTIGAGGGVLFGTAVGYPTEAEKLDNPEFRADTGFAIGNGGGVWLGGALADALVVAFGTWGGSFKSDDLEATGGAFVLRTELYPLFGLGGAYRDLSLALMFGAGGLQILRDEEQVADGGFISLTSAGVQWEAFRWGHFAMGPSLDYVYVFSQSLSASVLQLGGRIVFYGGPG